MIRENSPSVYRRRQITAVATAISVALGGGAVVKANTSGGSTYSDSPNKIAPATTSKAKKGPCPSAEKITSKNLSPACRGFLAKTLRRSVYDDKGILGVAAYQKTVNERFNPSKPLTVDGEIGKNTAKSILKGIALRVSMPQPSRTNGTEVIADKSSQTATIAVGGKVKHIISMSSGTEAPYTDTLSNGRVVTGQGDTPTGKFSITSEYGPSFTSTELGGAPMPEAHFINHRDGIAFHIGNVIPTGKQSHGCLRLAAETMNEVFDPLVKVGTPVTISE